MSLNTADGSLLASLIQAVYSETTTVSNITIVKETMKYILLTS